MWVGKLRRGGWQERLRREERLCSGGGKVCIYTVLGCGAGLELRYDTLSRILFYSIPFRFALFQFIPNVTSLYPPPILFSPSVSPPLPSPHKKHWKIQMYVNQQRTSFVSTDRIIYPTYLNAKKNGYFA